MYVITLPYCTVIRLLNIFYHMREGFRVISFGSPGSHSFGLAFLGYLVDDIKDTYCSNQVFCFK